MGGLHVGAGLGKRGTELTESRVIMLECTPPYATRGLSAPWLAWHVDRTVPGWAGAEDSSRTAYRLGQIDGK